MKARRATGHYFFSIIPVIFLVFVFISFFPAHAHAWKMEAGVVTLPAVSSGSTSFTTISLQQTYATAPLVFILPGEENSRPSAVRVRNITTTSFEAAQVEPPNEDGSQPATTVHYLAIEEGINLLPDGTTLEAGTVSTTSYQGKNVSGTAWDTVAFSSGFSVAPAVLAQIQTMNNESAGVPGAASVPWMTTTIKSVSATSFLVALERAETSTGSVSSAETIAYLAIRNGAGGSFTDNGGTTITYEALVSPDSITGNCTWVSFANSYSPTPLVIATQNRRDGGDGGWLRRCGSPNIESTRIRLEIDEDLLDGERNHTTESAGILVFSQSFAADILSPLADYHFDECALSDLGPLVDDTGSYNGTVHGGVTTVDSGQICKTGFFDGNAGSYVDLGNGAALQLNSGTLSAWIKTADAGGGYRGIITKLNAFGLYMRNNRLIIYDFGSGSRRDTGIRLDDNAWHHVAVTFQSGVTNGTIVYIDGTARLTTTMTVTNQAQPLIIGAGTNSSGTNGNFAGDIDEVLIFDTVLAGADIATIRANQSAGKNADGSARNCSVCATVVAQYQFDECSWNGTTDEVVDSGSSGYHGTATNATISNTAKFCRSGDFTANSTTDYVSLANGAADGLTEFSVSAWIKTANTGSQAILSGANATQYNEMLMWLNSSTQFRAFVQGSSRSIAITDVADNNWHHLVWTHSSGTSCLYRDSVLQGCQGGLPATAISIAPGGLIVGQEQDSLGNGFDINQDFEGNIDQLRIYSSALTSSEITSLFNETQTGCTSCVPPTTEWRFDECRWDGTSNEVVDEKGVAHGTKRGNATTLSGGQLCRAGTFDGAGDYADMGDALNTIFGSTNNVFTVTAWVNPTALGTAVTNHFTANTFFAKASDSFNDNIEIGVNPNGSVHVYIDSQGQDSYADFGPADSITLNTWNFVAVTYNNGTVSVTINTNTYTNSTTWNGGGNIDNAANSNLTIGASIHIDNYFTGTIDEVRVYQASLDPVALAAVEAETRPSCLSCIVPTSEWRTDECTYTGGAGEVLDNRSTNNGTTNGGVASLLTGQVCNTADFDGNAGSYISFGNPANLQVNSGTISAWIKTADAGGGYRGILTKRNAYGMFLRNNRLIIYDWGSGNRRDTGIRLDDDAWHHVTVTFQSGVANGTIIYIDGIARLTTTMTVVDQTQSVILGAGTNSSSTSGNFAGAIDEAAVYNRVLNSAEITTLYTNQAAGNNIDGTARTCACGPTTPDHYAISHSGSGITCEAEPVTITAHDSSEAPLNVAGLTVISLTTSSGNGDWYLVSGGGALNNGGLNDGAATYTFPGGASSVGLELAHSTAATVDIDVTDGTASAPDDGGAEDPPLVFSDSGFRFYQDGAYNTIETQIAGRSSDLNPGPPVLTLKAVQTSTDTGACIAKITGSTTVDIGYECVNPATCSAGKRFGIIDGTSTLTCTAGSPTGTPIDSNPAGSSTNKDPVTLTFDASGIATFTMIGCDVGKIALHAEKTIAAAGNDPAVTLTGSSNNFVVKPAGICVYSDDAGAGCSTPYDSCTTFKKAGETFNLKIKGVDWESAADADFCTGNDTTPNYSHDGMTFSYAQVAPATVPAPAPTLGITTLDLSSANHTVSSGVHTISDQSISEVGVFTFTATPPAYIDAGITIAASTSAEIGRFYPYRFTVSANTPAFADTCAAGTFTYLDQSFGYGTDPVFTVTAVNASGGVTKNYGGDGTGEDFWKLDAPTITAGNYNDTVGNTSTFSAPTPGTATWSSTGDFDGVGTLTISSASFLYDRPDPPIGPFNSSVDLALSAASLNDGDACYDVEPDTTCDPFTITGITGNTLRWGRALIGNTFGPEDAAQTIPFTIEYYNTTFAANTDDTCTSYDGTDLTCNVVTGPVACADVTEGGVGIQHGDSFTLTAPNTTGVLQYTLPVDTWLRYDWDGDSNHDNNPSANATFGIYRGNDRIINWREILR